MGTTGRCVGAPAASFASHVLRQPRAELDVARQSVREHTPTNADRPDLRRGPVERQDHGLQFYPGWSNDGRARGHRWLCVSHSVTASPGWSRSTSHGPDDGQNLPLAVAQSGSHQRVMARPYVHVGVAGIAAPIRDGPVRDKPIRPILICFRWNMVLAGVLGTVAMGLPSTQHRAWSSADRSDVVSRRRCVAHVGHVLRQAHQEVRATVRDGIARGARFSHLAHGAALESLGKAS